MGILPAGPVRRCALHISSPVGAWLSLVEHSVRDRGVGGSNPLAPTNSQKTLKNLHSSVEPFTRCTPQNPLSRTECSVLQTSTQSEIIQHFVRTSAAS